MNLNLVVARRIRKARLEQDWSQEYSAEQLKVSLRAWAKWESKGTVPISRLEQIARLFGKAPAWFMESDDLLPKVQSPGARAKKKAAAPK